MTAFRAGTLLLVTAIVGAGTPSDTRAPGTIAMAKRLADLAAAADPLRNPTLNAQRAALLSRRFQENPRTEIGFAAVRELLRAGDTDQALEIASMLEDAIDRNNVPDRDVLLTTARELVALSYLRAAEQRNCLAMHNAESCLLPMTGRGIHAIKGPAQSAAAMYAKLLEQTDRPSYRWLLNLAHMSAGDYPLGVPERWRIPPERFASQAPFGRFLDVAMSAGVAVRGGAGGAILDDFDGDGNLDLITTKWQLDDQMRYFRNDGTGHFTDRTVEAGLSGETGGIDVIQADYDNDGNMDVLVLRGGWLFDQGRQPNSLLHNRGDGTFEDVTEKAGLLRFHPTQSAAFADYDGDGWLDLFVSHESTPGDSHPCELFHNNHDGTFTEVGAQSGVANIGFVKGVAWGDYNNDGRPDLYLSRYGQPNVLFRNDGPAPGGGWKFTDVTAAAGVAEPVNSFPCWFFDFDNDGWLDLFVAPFTGFTSESLDLLAGPYVGRPGTEPRPRLYRNNHDGTFSDVTRAVGLDTPLAVMGAGFGDFDNDGFLDLYLGTGEPSLATVVPNRMFRNDRGRRFLDVTTAAGVGHLQKGHGIAVGDIDGDGDEDIYCVFGGSYAGDTYPNALFRNPGNRNHWIALTLHAAKKQTIVGARVAVTVESPAGVQTIHRAVGSVSSFGTMPSRQEIGLGAATRIRDVSIRWPTSQRVEHFDGVSLDRRSTLIEGSGRSDSR